MKRISLYLKTKVNLLALAFCGLSGGWWMIILAKRYYYFIIGTSQWLDPAHNSQILWSLAHGRISSSILGASFIVDHCYFLAILLTPIYWIGSDPMLLEYVKIAVFFGAAYLFFLILKKHLHPFIALGGMAAFTLAPANICLLFIYFTYEIMALPLIFLIFKSLDDHQYKPYIISCFLLTLVKEQMPLLVIMFGILSLFFKKEERIKWSLIPIVMGTVIFILEIFIITPYFRKGMISPHSFYWLRYLEFGQTPHAILLYLLTHPLAVLAKFTSTENINWFNDLFSFWGGLAFFSPQILLVALPLFLKTLLSNKPAEHVVIFYHYAYIFTPFIFLAAWNTLNHIRHQWRLAVHSLALSFMFLHAFNYMPLWLSYLHPSITNDTIAREYFIERIPPDASVLSSCTTLPPLANRRKIYPIFNHLLGLHYVTGIKFRIPDDTDYLLLDFSEYGFINYNRQRFLPRMTALNFDDRWRLKESIEDIALYVKNPSRQKADRLIEKSLAPFPVKIASPQTFDNTIGLDAVGFPHKFPQKHRLFPVTMYWQCLRKTNASYYILFTVSAAKGKSCYSKQRPIGSTIYPTDFWRKGEYIKESYVYLLPHMPQGNFDINIYTFNPLNKKWRQLNEEHFSVS